MRAPQPISLWSDVSQWSRLLKVQILCLAAPLLAGIGLSSLRSIFPLLGIHFSTCPTFQNVIDFLFLELLLFSLLSPVEFVGVWNGLITI